MNKLTANDFRNKILEVKAKMLGGLSYSEAVKELQPYLNEMNIRGEAIAKEYGKKFKKLTFNYIMR